MLKDVQMISKNVSERLSCDLEKQTKKQNVNKNAKRLIGLANADAREFLFDVM